MILVVLGEAFRRKILQPASEVEPAKQAQIKKNHGYDVLRVIHIFSARLPVS